MLRSLGLALADIKEVHSSILHVRPSPALSIVLFPRNCKNSARPVLPKLTPQKSLEFARSTSTSSRKLEKRLKVPDALCRTLSGKRSGNAISYSRSWETHLLS